MKKFECYNCTEKSVRYMTFKGWFSGKVYYQQYCAACFGKIKVDFHELTLDEFIAAKAMEAL